MPIVGSFAGASARAYGLGAGLPIVGDFESIASATVGSGGISTVEFNSIPADYTHLQIRFIGKGPRASTITDYVFTINNDSSSSYRRHAFFGDGSSVTANTGTSTNGFFFGRITGSSATNIFGAGIIDILDYTNTNKFKTVRALSGADANGSGEVYLNSGYWPSTSAITRLNFYSYDPATGTGQQNLSQYTSIQLYGVKA
jgi:hypothetical protein